MQPLIYLMTRTIKNMVKDLKKKPLALTLYIIIAISFIMMLVYSLTAPNIRNVRGSQEIFGAIVAGALIVFIYFGIKQGISRGNSFFRLADVNLAFTAPISPKKVLLYGFIKQFFATFFIIIFFSFQLPNLLMNFSIKEYGVAIIYISVYLLFFSMQLIGMLIFSISSKSGRIRSVMEKALNILLLPLVGGMLAYTLKTKDLIKAGVIFLNNDYINYIPFLGWFKVILDTAVRGVDSLFYLNCIFVLLSLLVMVYVIYKLKTDYYEDVLSATERREELLKIKKEGKGNPILANTKVRKVNYTFTSSGAGAIFHRHMLEYRKSGFFLINRSTVYIIAIGIASKYFFPQASIKTVLFFCIYLLFFSTIQGKWMQELSKPYIYLIPSNSATKVFYATLADVLKYSIDGLVLFAAAGFMFKADLLTILLSALTYATFGAIYTYGDVLFHRLLGSMHSKNLDFFLKMFLILFVVAPGLIVSIIISLITGSSGFGQYSFYLVLITYNIIISAVALLLSKGIFERLEMN